MIFIKCKNADIMPSLGKKIDDLYRNSDFPTRTQTEEAFGKMFVGHAGRSQDTPSTESAWRSSSHSCSLAGNAMAMAMRERTAEVAVLKAIGFPKELVLFLVLTEAVLVSGLGGALGTLGCKAFLRLRRYLAVHGRVPAVLLRFLEHRAPGTGNLAVHRLRQRLHSRRSWRQTPPWSMA